MNATELGELADHYWATQIKRLAADKVAAALKAEEQRAEAAIITEMLSQKITAIGGKSVRLTLPGKPAYSPAAKDWTKVYAYIIENDAFELLEKRLGKLACRERWDAGVTIPGVEKFPVWKLSHSSAGL